MNIWFCMMGLFAFAWGRVSASIDGGVALSRGWPKVVEMQTKDTNPDTNRQNKRIQAPADSDQSVDCEVSPARTPDLFL